MNLEEECKKKLKVIRAQTSYATDFELNKIIEREIKQNLALKIGEELYKSELLDFEYEYNESSNIVKAVFAFITKKDLKEIISDVQIKKLTEFKERISK